MIVLQYTVVLHATVYCMTELLTTWYKHITCSLLVSMLESQLSVSYSSTVYSSTVLSSMQYYAVYAVMQLVQYAVQQLSQLSSCQYTAYYCTTACYNCTTEYTLMLAELYCRMHLNIVAVLSNLLVMSHEHVLQCIAVLQCIYST